MQSYLDWVIQRVRKGELEGIRLSRLHGAFKVTYLHWLSRPLQGRKKRVYVREANIDSGQVVCCYEFDLVAYRLGFLFRLDQDMSAAGTALRLFGVQGYS